MSINTEGILALNSSSHKRPDVFSLQDHFILESRNRFRESVQPTNNTQGRVIDITPKAFEDEVTQQACG